LVYVWGDNSEGQLGLGDGVSEAELPEQLRLDEKAVHISCGYYHTAVVTGYVSISSSHFSGRH